MSWPQWPVGGAPALTGVINPAPAVVNPSAGMINPSPGIVNPAAAVMPTGVQYTPEQWANMQQQNWQQWAQWQQQYQQWHQQYGAEVLYSYFCFYSDFSVYVIKLLDMLTTIFKKFINQNSCVF